MTQTVYTIPNQPIVVIASVEPEFKKQAEDLQAAGTLIPEDKQQEQNNGNS